MDPVIFIIASLITVYLLNIFLGYLQLKDFNKNYIELKRKGRVAIGRKRKNFIGYNCVDTYK